MFPFVALQADKLLGEPRNTNMPPFLYAVCYFSRSRLSNTNMTARLQMHIHIQTEKISAFVIHSAVYNFFCQHAYTQHTVTRYINITIETIVCNIDMGCYNNIRAQELICLLTFQSNDNFILS